MATAISSSWPALSGEHLAFSSLVLVSSRFLVAHRLVRLVAKAQDTPERRLDHRFAPAISAVNVGSPLRFVSTLAV
jgi:hypothetical protein